MIGFVSCLYVVGIALTVYVLKAQSKPNRQINLYILGVAGISFFNRFIDLPLTAQSGRIPIVYDTVLYRMEGMTGLIQPSLCTWLLIIDADCKQLFLAIYEMLPLIVMMAASSEVIYSTWTIKDNLISRFIAGAVIGFLLYFLMPAVGPQLFFLGDHTWSTLPRPDMVPPRGVLFADGGVNARNAMPSLHATWSILSLLALRRSPWWHRVIGVAYVTVTFMTTIGVGFHYIVDWVAALPLVLLLRSMTAELPLVGLRGVAMAMGGWLLAFWVAAVRGAPESLEFPILIKLLVAASVIIPVWLEHLLSQAESGRFLQKAAQKLLPVQA